jgi:hypothetical protein
MHSTVEQSREDRMAFSFAASQGGASGLQPLDPSNKISLDLSLPRR